MAIFKTKGVVLQVGKYSENNLYYKVFFRDYGILTVTKKKKAREKPIDIGYCVSCEVITRDKSSVHTIGNIKIISYFKTQNTPYDEIESFLLLLSYIKKSIPEGTPHYEVFDILTSYIPLSNSGNIQKLLLTKLKIISSFGELGEIHENPTTTKILKFIHTNKYIDILRLGAIPEENTNHLKQLH